MVSIYCCDLCILAQNFWGWVKYLSASQPRLGSRAKSWGWPENPAGESASVEDKSQALCLRMAQKRKYPWSQQQQPPWPVDTRPHFWRNCLWAPAELRLCSRWPKWCINTGTLLYIGGSITHLLNMSIWWIYRNRWIFHQYSSNPLIFHHFRWKLMEKQSISGYPSNWHVEQNSYGHP